MISSTSTRPGSSHSALTATHDFLMQLSQPQRSETEVIAALTELLQTPTGAKGFFLGYLSAFQTLPTAADEIIIQVIETASEATIQCFLERTAISAAMVPHYQAQKQIELVSYYQQLQQRSITFLNSLNSAKVQSQAEQFLIGLTTHTGRYQTFLENWNYNSEQKQAIAQTLSLICQPVPVTTGTKKQWFARYEDRPWLDLASAEDAINHKYQNHEISQQEYHWLKQWQTDGYFIADNLIELDLINQMNQELDDLWYADVAIPGALFHNLGLNAKENKTYTHAEILDLDIQTREKMRDCSRWRIHGVQQFSSAAKQIFNHPQLNAISSLILGKPAQAHFSISFRRGSEQALHEDMSVFHIFPLNHLLGVWIATEDISPDSGPLVYYPGSHQAKLYDSFDNYPQTNLRTIEPGQMQDYYDYVEQRVKDRYPRKLFIAKKGQVLFWHGMLVHGGSMAKDPNLTRKSLVLHFVTEGVNRDGEVHGPFNW